MTTSPSRAFRRWCAATTLLVVSWSLPGSVYGRVSPMEIVKQQLRKPNFLIMVESAESMQGIPGENPTRYNEVGADCEKGDRYCRLYGQPNRCEFSGMGGQGYKFDFVSAGTATQTQSETVVTSTMTLTKTGTGTLTDRTTVAVTSTSTTPSGATSIQTATGTQTVAATQTAYSTATQTGSTSYNNTSTVTGSSSYNNTSTVTASSSYNNTSTVTASTSYNNTSTITGSSSYNNTSTITGSSSYNNTSTITGSSSYNNTSTITGSSSYNNTSTITGSSSYNNTSTITGSSSYNNTSTVTGSSSQNTTSSSYSTGHTTASAIAVDLTDNLVGYWPLDSASAVDVSGNGNNGTIAGSLTSVAGKWNTAARFLTAFDGTPSNYVNISTSTTLTAPGTHFSVAVWVSPTSVGPVSTQDQQNLVAYDGGKNDTKGSGFRLALVNAGSTPSHRVCMDNNSNTASLGICETGMPDISGSPNWTLIVGTISGTGWTLYRYTGGCGSPVVTADTVSSASFAAIGTWHFGASGMDHLNGVYGSLDEIRIWNSTLVRAQADDLCNYNYTSHPAPTGTATTTYTQTSLPTVSGATTSTQSVSVTSTSTGTLSTTSSQSNTSTNTGTLSTTSSRSGTSTNTGTLSTTSSQSGTSTNTGTLSTTSSHSNTSTNTGTLSTTSSQSGTSTNTGTLSTTSSQSGTSTNTGTLTTTSSKSGTSTNTGTLTTTSSKSGTSTNTGTLSTTSSHSGTSTSTGTLSTTSSQSGTSTNTSTLTTTASKSAATTNTGLTSNTGTVWGATSATGTVTQSATVPSIVTFTDLDGTQTLSATNTLTGTATTTLALKPVPDLDNCTPSSCTWATGVSSSYCYLNSLVPCYSNDDCANLTKGDFCRYIDTGDGSGRFRNDFCSSSTSKTCRYQTTTPCNNDSQCDGGKGDYCVFGKPANMCQKSGLWCTDDGMGCDGSSGDACVPATSRMMMVKNAVRRVVLEHAYDDTAVVKMGHMHTYQAGNGSTDNLFPYVKLDTTSVGTSFLTSTRIDTKFLPRSELLKGVGPDSKPCFSETTGPSSPCTIDYSGGAVALMPAVTYTLQSSNDSRYAVPTGDGKTYVHENASWSSPPPNGTGCGVLCPFSDGKGIYEGSYYTFSYTFGVPVVGSPSDAPGTGSMYAPYYSTTYRGKSYVGGGYYWYLMDAERSEFVNENKYGAREFAGLSSGGAGLPWSQGYLPDGTEYPLPLVGANGDPMSTSATCGPSNGAQWDHNVVPMVNDTSFVGNSNLKPVQKALLNAARLDKASYGGFYATGHLQPVACALKDDGQNDKYHSIDNYMSIVQGNDTVANGTSPCWENHVLMVVDGLPRGPGDVAVGGVDCGAAACTYDPVANPNLTGCVCPAVFKARSLAVAGVNVHVIAATTDLTTRNSYANNTLINIAAAGSTSPSFINIPRYAASEDELYYWLNYEMKEALRFTVSTTPAAAATSLSGATADGWLFQTTVELPEWKGNLVGFQIASAAGTTTVTTTSGTTATATAVSYSASVRWDAGTQNAFTVWRGTPLTDAQQQLWKQRQIYFSDDMGNVHQIVVDSDGKMTDSGIKTKLKGLGMGVSEAETEQIVQWMLGKIDPSDTTYHRPLNPAVMGSVVNSMPIDVGPPGASLFPGGMHFSFTHANRPELVYVGADDGMLHAFYAGNGREAFAFIPADMVPVIAKLYAQGGQRYSPNDHIYGLAGSPKVKNLCVANCNVTGPNCSDDQGGSYTGSNCPDWRTILIMGEGPGGNHPFALDITDPVASGSAALDNTSLLWHAGYKQASHILPADLGETNSVPAFAHHRTTDESDNRVLMTSGYPLTGGSTTTKLIDATLLDGGTPSVAGAGATIGGLGGCDSSTGQEFAVLADVAVARDNFHNGASPADENLLAAYVADTWGTVHQYAPAYSPALDKGVPALSLGCHHPLHFSPALAQLNHNNSNNPDNSVFLAQVTNSILDPNTVAVTSSFPASKLVIAKLSSIGTAPPAKDESFGTSGMIQLSADESSDSANRLCGVTLVGKTSAASDCGSGGSWLPASARPTGTPVAVARTDGTGFQIYTAWYEPPKANWDTCPESMTSGNSYVTLHEFLTNGTWSQIAGRAYPHQYVTGVQFMGTTLFITFGTNGSPPNSNNDNFGQTYQPVTPQNTSALSGDRYIKTAWAERMDIE